MTLSGEYSRMSFAVRHSGQRDLTRDRAWITTDSAPADGVVDIPNPALPSEVTIGILTMLPVEGAAMARLIDDIRIVELPDDPNTYRVGTLPSKDPVRPHRVALNVLPRDSTRSAAAACANLLRSFAGVRTVVVVGIAGGIPRPGDPSQHVRLGDIVVATSGMVDYGHSQASGIRRAQLNDGHLSISLLRSANELQLMQSIGSRPWEVWLDPDRCEFAKEYPRPADEADRLFVDSAEVAHPDRRLSGHPPSGPKVHHGLIGSSDALVRDESAREDLVAAFRGVRAIEMEGSGVVAAAAGHDVSWFMVRGVADYCDDSTKGDTWHRYSSYAAAAYVRCLLAECRPNPVAAPSGAARGPREVPRAASEVGRPPEATTSSPDLSPGGRAVRIEVEAETPVLGPGEPVKVQITIGAVPDGADWRADGEVTVVLLAEDADVSPGSRRMLLGSAGSAEPAEFTLMPRRATEPALRILIFSTVGGVLLQELRTKEVQRLSGPGTGPASVQRRPSIRRPTPTREGSA